MFDDDVAYAGTGFLQGSVRTYGKAIRLIQEAWERVLGSEMPAVTGPPRERYFAALELLEAEFARAKSTSRKLAEELEAATKRNKDAGNVLDDTFDVAGGKRIVGADIEDVSPALFRRAAYVVARKCSTGGEAVDMSYASFLRDVGKILKKEMKWSRALSIGNNRHFGRQLQWTRELEVQTDWEDGRGFRLMNVSGRGRVALDPAGPSKLKIRLDPRFL